MWRSVVLAIVAEICGCTAIANSPMITQQLKYISAGHTGCLPDDNDITNLNANANGSGTWNATCKGKVYLCSSVASGNEVSSYACAPAVQ